MYDYDPLYVAARSVLLDALGALGSQRDAAIVVGAQAVYMRTGDADVAVAPYTTDADLALAPGRLAAEPRIEDLLRAAEFTQQAHRPGSWIKRAPVGQQSVDISVDIMVPDALAPPGGRRGVRIEPHDKMAARKAVGLEGAVIDNDIMDMTGLDGRDPRSFAVRVAGPAALMVAKLHKLHDRLTGGRADRIADKDAADVYRMMQAVPVGAFVARFRPLLADPSAKASSEVAVELLRELFGARANQGVRMASDAFRSALPAERIETICTTFARQVRQDLGIDPAWRSPPTRD
jgi:hypothetical protein